MSWSEEKDFGLALLRKWKTVEAEIQVFLTVALFSDFTLRAVGKVEEVTENSLHIVGKGFSLDCNFGVAEFKRVFSEELLLEINPALVGSQPETLELIFRENERCVLTRASKLPD